MARALDGTGDFYTQAAAAVTAYPFTFGCLIFLTDVTASTGAMQICDGTSTHDWSLENNASANSFRFRCSDAGGAQAATSGATLSNSTWYSFVGVGTSATNRACFIDGANKGTSAVSRTPVSVNATKIGDTTVRTELAGAICAAWIANTNWSDAEVAALTVTPGSLYRSPLLVKPSSVIRYWRFINTSTGNETDLMTGAVMVENGNPTNTTHPTVYEPGPFVGGFRTLGLAGSGRLG